jgi:RNA recognition motif-containing protein
MSDTDNLRLFVQGFTKEMDEDFRRDLITKLFSEYGQVGKISVIPDKKYGGLRSFCFVEMDTTEAAQSVIDNLNHHMIEDEVELSISMAQPQEQNNDRRGGNGGGGYNRNGGGFRPQNGGGDRRPRRDYNNNDGGYKSNDGGYGNSNSGEDFYSAA